ncbi:MAG: PIN domain nuclease [Clostridiales bacterium]|nr:PIN domain nuclease [Clostridiales bacterium]
MDDDEKRLRSAERKAIRKTIRVTMALIGLTVGPVLLAVISALLDRAGLWRMADLPWWQHLLCYAILGIVTCILFILLTPRLLNLLERIERRLQAMPLADIAAGAAGLVIGLVIAFLLSRLAEMIPVPWLALAISILLYLMLGYIGLSVGAHRREDLAALLDIRGRISGRRARSDAAADGPLPKILDTSVIIDGRIFDIAKTGFLEGPVWVPRFVLTELRHIADSPDMLKRNRGRRGLDVLGQIRRELSMPVEVPDTDYDDLTEVDQKLLRLAKETGGKVVTNDYNLNKVAGVQGVRVLNINELANAVKPVALPGEEMTITIVKEGKEAGQGVGFLPDGTMVVVENGSRLQGATVDVVVTSSLQTAAGRMVFGRLRDD